MKKIFFSFLLLYFSFTYLILGAEKNIITLDSVRCYIVNNRNEEEGDKSYSSFLDLNVEILSNNNYSVCLSSKKKGAFNARLYIDIYLKNNESRTTLIKAIKKFLKWDRKAKKLKKNFTTFTKTIAEINEGVYYLNSSEHFDSGCDTLKIIFSTEAFTVDSKIIVSSQCFLSKGCNAEDEVKVELFPGEIKHLIKILSDEYIQNRLNTIKEEEKRIRNEQEELDREFQ